MLHAVSHLDPFQGVLYPLLAFLRRHAAVGQRQLDILIDVEIADQIECLENEADLAVAHPGPPARRELLDRIALQLMFAGGRRIEQSENRQQGRLAATRRTGDRHKLAATDLHRYGREGVRLHLLGKEHFVHCL